MKNKYILWIDDMQNWSEVVISNLRLIAGDKNVDIHPIYRANGEDLVQVFMMHQFDIIVMDFHMEPFNGDIYIKQIRNEEHLESIPIVFYSQDPNVDLASLVSDVKNVHITSRIDAEDLVKSFILK